MISNITRLIGLVILPVAALAACSEPRNHYVIAATGTSIGIDVSLDQAKTTPQGRIGYYRGEIAIVPTDRKNCVISKGANGERALSCDKEAEKGSAKSTAKAAPNVLMEINMHGALSSDGLKVYQRLAVGDIAVKQPGAAALFAKDDKGKVTPSAADVIAATVDPAKVKKITDDLEQLKSRQIFISEYFSDNNGKIDKAKITKCVGVTKLTPPVKADLLKANEPAKIASILGSYARSNTSNLYKSIKEKKCD